MNRKHRNWITIWLIVVSALLIVTGTYAAYTSVKYAKSVAVARKEGDGVRFSSNYLDLKTIGETPQLKVLSASGNAVSVAITVCNYTQNEPDLALAGDITYDMRIDIRDANGKSLDDIITYTKQDGTTDTVSKSDLLNSLSVNNTSSNGETLTFNNNTLTGGSSTQDIYTITCTQPEYLSAISIIMTATPTGGTIDDINGKVLTARLKILTSTSQTGWTGRITDQPGVDAFNFEMSGTTEETMILSWDSSKVEISIWSAEELGIKTTTTTNNRTKARINLGGVGKPTSYRLQFYRTSAIPADETPDALNGYVTLSSAPQDTE